MRKMMKAVLIAFSTIATVAIATGCSSGKTAYDTNDELGYTVSVKFDANGGYFGENSNTTVIVDSYNISDMEQDSDGNVSIALIAPDSEMRKDIDSKKAKKLDCFLAGWYTDREEIIDESGQPAYKYSGRWDFENDLLTVDAKQSYSASEPVITLYAAWVPDFTIEYYERNVENGTETLLETVSINPMTQSEIMIPAVDVETGAMEMYDFPTKDGYTFDKVYYDPEGTQPIMEEKIMHPGQIDLETGTAVNPVFKVYVDWKEGEWYHIYTAKQFAGNAKLNGHYIIYEDLDFSEVIWPTVFVHGVFQGEIQGNGHTFSNISFEQTNNAKQYSGLFGQLADGAILTDLTLDNITFTIKSGTRVQGATFGLLAGYLSEMANLNKVQIKNSTLLIDSKSNFLQSDYQIGLVCGMGDATVVKKADITCEATGDNPEKIVINIDGNQVNLEFVTE